jgi:CheY-like chemotaxis protein
MITPQHNPQDHADSLRVLVVDDNLLMRTRAASWLEGWGIEVVPAEDGSQALRLVEEGGNFYLVLMDLQMPVMNGFAATANIRRLERTRTPASLHRLPIVAFTTHDVGALEPSLPRLGFDSVLAKPFTGGELRACLARWCPNKIREHDRGEAV